MNFKDIYEAVKKVPYGKVATYGQIACMAGNPRGARIVGYALHVNPDPETIKCHRVVNRFGGLSDAFAFSSKDFSGKEEHKRRLEEEGIVVREDYTVDLNIYSLDLLK